MVSLFFKPYQHLQEMLGGSYCCHELLNTGVDVIFQQVLDIATGSGSGMLYSLGNLRVSCKL